MKFWFNSGADKPYTDKNISDHLQKVKTPEQFFEFVEKAKTLNTELASYQIYWMFAHPYILGEDNYYPVYATPEEFDPELYSKMVDEAFDALKGMPDGAKHIANIIHNEVSYLYNLKDKANNKGIKLPEPKSHMNEAIAALIERNDAMAIHALGYFLSKHYPKEAIMALHSVDSDLAVLGLEKAGSRRYGITDEKIMVLECLLDIADSVKNRERKNTNIQDVKSAIKGVCQTLLRGEGLTEEYIFGMRVECEPETEKENAQLRALLEEVDELLGHEDYIYTELFDLSVGFQLQRQDGRRLVGEAELDLAIVDREVKSGLDKTTQDLGELYRTAFPECA